ncbi:hypothetical protein [Celerinatantimonas sp. YJH-8]|uniref:hypothetical protein n=1 Tax=Celerinatantimonas sp. YJH-8 TaxID=3228714 RepID=UPI0038BFA1DF
MKQWYAGVLVLILCVCALLQLASPAPFGWFFYTLVCAFACLLSAWNVWHRKFVFICLIVTAAGLGWQWMGTLWLLTKIQLWDSVTFFSSHTPFLQMRHALILWIIFLSLGGIILWNGISFKSKDD